MASLALVFKNAEFKVGPASTSTVISGTVYDFSAQVRSITINYSKELLDASTMGVGATRQRVAGLLDWSINIEFNQDYAAAGIDDILFPLVNQISTAWVSIIPVKTTVAATNPQFHGDAFLETYPPISGGVAAVAIVTSTFQGSGALNRVITRYGP